MARRGETRGKEAATHVHGVNIKDEDADKMRGEDTKPPSHPFQMGCPGSMAREIKRSPASPENRSVSGESELRQWPIQLKLVSPFAPYFNQSDLLVAADCTAFALGSFHQDLLKGKKLIIACPKLDDISGYVEKLSEILKNNTVYSLTVATMVVPCCAGLVHIAEKAVELSGTNINIKKIVIGVDGEISTENEHPDQKMNSSHPSSK